VAPDSGEFSPPTSGGDDVVSQTGEGTFAAARRFWRVLGPGIITGAADDEPSGIATYSIAGAQFGTGLLWTALLTWPLMAAVQTMCARIGMVTGRGLMGALRRKFPKPLLLAACGALFIANTINIGADLSGMADAAELLTRVNSHIWVVLFGVLRDNGLYCRPALAPRSARHLCPEYAAGARRMGYGGRDLRYYYQSLSLFLAGI